jgi:hypothetical protein
MESNYKEQFLDTRDYLPDFLKDFHDQKDFFKAMHELYAKRLGEELPAFNWRDSHIYTVDFLLWFLGAHGYKLTKARKKGVRFCDINATIEHFNNKRLETFGKMPNSTPTPERSIATDAASSTGDDPKTDLL